MERRIAMFRMHEIFSTAERLYQPVFVFAGVLYGRRMTSRGQVSWMGDTVWYHLRDDTAMVLLMAFSRSHEEETTIDVWFFVRMVTLILDLAF